MQDWLTVIGVLLIVGILLDGVRRMRNAKRDNIRVSRNVKRNAVPELSEQEPRNPYTSELPNGGARIVAENDLQSANEKPSVRAPVKKRAPRKPPTIPQQVTLNLDESVPMLMESVDERANESVDEDLSDADVPLTASMNERIEPSFDHDFSAGESASLSESNMEVGFESNEFDVDGSENEYEADTEEMVEPEEVIIINVMMVNKQYFQGEALLDVLLQSGMRYGDMNIFHRYTNTNGNGSVLFSLANMVKPGDFNLDSMAQFQTPGVSLFMTLPIKADSLKAFDTMRQTAEAIASALNGELNDEDRNRMTHQTMEHCRQRIQDYERKRLSRVGA